MPKYTVSFERYAYYTVPVEAASADEAREHAWAIVDAGRLEEYQDYMSVDLAKDDLPNTEEIDDACFARFSRS